MGLFARMGQLFKGFVSLFVSGLEEGNPEALMEAAKQDFRNKTAQYNQALARLAGIAERLKIQIKNKIAKTKMLEQRVLANHKANNLQLAGSLARELQELKTDLETDSQELKETEEAYEVNVRNAKVVQKEFEEKIRRLERQLSQVKVKEAQAEAAAALSGVAFKVGDMGDTLKNVDEILQKKYEKSAGKLRVAHDMADIDTVREKESESKALDQAALADFLSQQGIAMESESTAAPAPKEMGPAQTQ